MRGFWIIAIVALLWNLAGDFAWYSQSHADLAAMAKTDPVTARIWQAMPGWAWAAYAVATWSGTAGAIALLARHRFAVPLFALSLLCVIIQFGWSFLGTDLLATKGPTTLVFPALIALIALAETLWSRRQVAAGVLR